MSEPGVETSIFATGRTAFRLRRAVACLSLTVSLGATAYASDSGSTALGPLTPFYRAATLQATVAEQRPGKEFLRRIPANLTDPSLDYPYQRMSPNPSGLEVPYATMLHFNRVLGGQETGESADLMRYSAGSGQWTTNYKQFLNGFRPFLEAGYQPRNIKIALAKVPWDISTKTCPDGGNATDRGGRNLAPVANYPQWQALVEGFARSLDTATNGRASDIGFYLGGETNARTQFCGSMDDYEKQYAATVESLKHVFSAPHIMPYPFLGKPQWGHINTIAIYQWIAAQGLPVAAVGKTANENPNRMESPGFFADSVASAFDAVYAQVPALRGTPAYIDQFGLLGDKIARASLEAADNGPRKASWLFQTLFRLAGREHFTEISHWPLFDEIPTSSSDVYLLPTAQSWLYQVLDNLNGAQMYALRNAAAPADGDIDTYAVGFVRSDRLTVLASTYNVHFNDGTAQSLSISVPASLLPGRSGAHYRVRSIPMAVENTPGYVLKTLIQRNSVPGVGLADPYGATPNLVGHVAEMSRGTAGSVQAIGDLLVSPGPVAASVVARVKGMFTLSPYNQSLFVRNADGNWTLDAGSFSPGEMKLFVIDLH